MLGGPARWWWSTNGFRNPAINNYHFGMVSTVHLWWFWLILEMVYWVYHINIFCCVFFHWNTTLCSVPGHLGASSLHYLFSRMEPNGRRIEPQRMQWVHGSSWHKVVSANRWYFSCMCHDGRTPKMIMVERVWTFDSDHPSHLESPHDGHRQQRLVNWYSLGLLWPVKIGMRPTHTPGIDDRTGQVGCKVNVTVQDCRFCFLNVVMSEQLGTPGQPVVKMVLGSRRWGRWTCTCPTPGDTRFSPMRRLVFRLMDESDGFVDEWYKCF